MKPPAVHLLALVASVEWQQEDGRLRPQVSRTHRTACMHVSLPEPAAQGEPFARLKRRADLMPPDLHAPSNVPTDGGATRSPGCCRAHVD